MEKASLKVLVQKNRRKRSLQEIASGFLQDMIKDADGVDLVDLDALLTHIHGQLLKLVATQPKRWPKQVEQQLGPLVVEELNRLLRRRQLIIVGDRTFLYVKVHEDELRLVHSRL